MVDLSIAAAGFRLALAGHVLAHVSFVQLARGASVASHLVGVIAFLTCVRFRHAVAATFWHALIHLGDTNMCGFCLAHRTAVSYEAVSIVADFAFVDASVSAAFRGRCGFMDGARLSGIFGNHWNIQWLEIQVNGSSKESCA